MDTICMGTLGKNRDMILIDEIRTDPKAEFTQESSFLINRYKAEYRR